MSDSKEAAPAIESPPSYDATEKPSKPALPRIPFPLDLPILNTLRGKRVILASASPRRKQLLSHLGLTNVEIIPCTVPENFPKSLSPFEYVLQTATQKATNVYTAQLDQAGKPDPALVLAADTVVVGHAGQIMEKPRSQAEHIAMLKTLRDGGAHKVFTAVVAMAPLESLRDPGYAIETTVEETTVRFDRAVTDDLILAYVRTREGADKAGGYGLQGIGSVLVERIEGAWDNVVGLPLRATLLLIERVLTHDENVEEDMGTPFLDD